jgi:hypothetical protein
MRLLPRYVHLVSRNIVLFIYILAQERERAKQSEAAEVKDMKLASGAKKYVCRLSGVFTHRSRGTCCGASVSCAGLSCERPYFL